MVIVASAMALSGVMDVMRIARGGRGCDGGGRGGLAQFLVRELYTVNEIAYVPLFVNVWWRRCRWFW